MFKGLVTKSIFVENNILVVNPAIINSYTASLIADFIRQQLLKNGAGFSFETVMSHQSKINFLNAANKQGYKTYFYFVFTNNPEINYQRVLSRVAKGGHTVDKEKLLERYKRSNQFFKKACEIVDRCYVFDNTNKLELIQEYKSGKLI